MTIFSPGGTIMRGELCGNSLIHDKAIHHRTGDLILRLSGRLYTRLLLFLLRVPVLQTAGKAAGVLSDIAGNASFDGGINAFPPAPYTGCRKE